MLALFLGGSGPRPPGPCRPSGWHYNPDVTRSVRQVGFSLIEVAVSIGIVVVLLAILIPALTTARSVSHLECCAGHQQQLGEIWQLYLDDHGAQFPFVAVQPGWHYGGARFSSVTGASFIDPQRPLNAYLGGQPGNREALDLFRCPADRGNTTSAGLRVEPRGLRRREIAASPSRLLLIGDSVWYEAYYDTGREAAWHGESTGGNMLFLDGSVRFETVLPGTANQPVMFDPGATAIRSTPDLPTGSGASGGESVVDSSD